MASSFIEYLTSLNSTLNELAKEEPRSLHVTVGNEACDLDSIACAISHAHFIAEQDMEVVSLPLLQCSREDFVLRTDVVWLFGELNINPSVLLFCEDVVRALKGMSEVKVTLVDHALLSSPLRELANMQVIEVIDHHTVADVIFGEECHVIIEPVGSCATLVAEKLLEVEDYAMPSAIATLLLGAILLDTVGLVKEKGRTTEKDEAFARQLAPFSSLPQAQLYSSLSRCRFSTAGLSTKQLLRKDFKCVEAGDCRLGFSSVPCRLPEFLERVGAEGEMQSFCQSQGLSAMLLLGVWQCGDTVNRQVAVFQPQGSDLADCLASILESDRELECHRVPSGDFPCILVAQGNTTLSRKYILPLVVNFISALDHAMTTQHKVPAVPKLSRADSQVVASSDGEGEGAAVLAVAGPPTPAAATPVSLIPEYTVEEEARDTRSQCHVCVGREEAVVDMEAIQPYKKIIQHGGYVGPERQAVVVLSACYLPSRSLPDYHDIMHQLFFYVMSVVQRLVMDDYVIVYLHSGAPQHSMPSVSFFHKFYRTVDHRLRKQLKHLYIVHPTFWVRSILQLARPFVSSKFYHKVHLVRNLQHLSEHVTVDSHVIPAPVTQVDSTHKPHPSQPSTQLPHSTIINIPHEIVTPPTSHTPPSPGLPAT